MKKLKIEFGFGVGEDKYRKPIASVTLDQALGIICELAAKRFGGYTLYDTVGGWVNPKTNNLIKEPGMTLMVFCSIHSDPFSPGSNIVEERMRKEALDASQNFVKVIKDVLNQECVCVTTTEVDMTCI